ncbi:hypothetical protein [uncultured Parvimonas sp.]|uniref:hypothetical protein n=1 Tax=uncultured Parvimonas sp. TaxID=747372 RepID=UPI0028D44127|nr:hypothetical protein [uncultured Parvimonas sp.]
MKTYKIIENLKRMIVLIAIISYLVFNIVIVVKAIRFNIIIGLLLMFILAIVDLSILEAIKREINEDEEE